VNYNVNVEKKKKMLTKEKGSGMIIFVANSKRDEMSEEQQLESWKKFLTKRSG
jgi:hypothetical protein